MERATIAIDRQLAIAQRYRNPRQIVDETRSLWADDPKYAKTMVSVLAELPNVMAASDPIYVSQEIADQLTAAKDTLPEPPTIYRENVFTTGGFVVWGDSTYSLHWAMGKDTLGVVSNRYTEDDFENVIMLSVFSYNIYMFTLAIALDTPIQEYYTFYSSIIDEDLKNPDGMSTQEWYGLTGSFVDDLASLLAFASQKVSVTTDQRAERATRKRYQREHKTEPPPIRVISFRRRVHTAPAQPGASGRHVSVRFIRRGHWRNQWYPSRQRHEPVWIEQTIVGPEDAPVKGKVNLFKVER